MMKILCQVGNIAQQQTACLACEIPEKIKVYVSFIMNKNYIIHRREIYKRLMPL